MYQRRSISSKGYILCIVFWRRSIGVMYFEARSNLNLLEMPNSLSSLFSVVAIRPTLAKLPTRMSSWHSEIMRNVTLSQSRRLTFRQNQQVDLCFSHFFSREDTAVFPFSSGDDRLAFSLYFSKRTIGGPGRPPALSWKLSGTIYDSRSERPGFKPCQRSRGHLIDVPATPTSPSANKMFSESLAPTVTGNWRMEEAA